MTEVQDLSKILSATDTKGRVFLTVGLVSTIFFEKPWTREVREAVADVTERYIEAFRPHLKYAMAPQGAKIHSIESRRVPFPREWLPQHPDGESWVLGFHGGESALSTSPFQVSAFGPDDIMKGLGCFHFSLPLVWFADHPGTFQEYVLDVSRRLRPISGYGGVGVIESLDLIRRKDYQPIVRVIAERFPGIEIESRAGHANHLHEGIKGVNWITILSDCWIKEMGGIDYLRARLDESFVFYRYEGGLIIQAGPRPQIGDIKADRWPQHYVTLAKVLKKIQIKNHYPFHFGGPGRMDHQASLAWLFRFDGK